MPHVKIQQGASIKLTVGGARESEQEGRESERKKIKHQPHFPFESLNKEPHDVGLRGWTDSTSVANWEKIHMESFHIRSD